MVIAKKHKRTSTEPELGALSLAFQISLTSPPLPFVRFKPPVEAAGTPLLLFSKLANIHLEGSVKGILDRRLAIGLASPVSFFLDPPSEFHPLQIR